MIIVQRYKDGTFNSLFTYKKVFFNDTNFNWTRWEDTVWIKSKLYKIKVTKRNGYYICNWNYKGNKYKIYFGYGVDIFLYKKYKLVNFYHSPIYFLNKVKNWCWRNRN